MSMIDLLNGLMLGNLFNGDDDSDVQPEPPEPQGRIYRVFVFNETVSELYQLRTLYSEPEVTRFNNQDDLGYNLIFIGAELCKTITYGQELRIRSYDEVRRSMVSEVLGIDVEA